MLPTMMPAVLRHFGRQTTRRAVSTWRPAVPSLSKRLQVAGLRQNSGVQSVTPQSLDEYDIDFNSPLGYGAIGTVYAGQHRRTAAEVAIKVVSSVLVPGERTQGALDSDELSDSIIHETQAFTQMIGAGVSHPHIVDCSGCFEGPAEEALSLGLDLTEGAAEEPLHYFVMERLHGNTLVEYIADKQKDGGSIDEKECSRIMRAVCQGLECLHENGIVHRDIKPGNVMLSDLSDDFDVKLIDFSHAGVVPETVDGQLPQTSAAEATVFTKKLGTQGYVAPEVLKQKDPYSASCDVFSLGCTMHALLAEGRVPHRTRGRMMTSLPDSISADGRDLVDALLSYSPEDRPTISEALKGPWLQQCG